MANPRDYIVRRTTGKYSVGIMIQDGMEDLGLYNTDTEAVEAWISAQDVYNHNKVTADDAPTIVYEPHPLSLEENLCLLKNRLDAFVGLTVNKVARMERRLAALEKKKKRSRRK